jgi:hypothetical protein
MADRLTQIVTKNVQGPGNPKGRMTQIVTKSVQGPGVPKARVTYIVCKILCPAGSALLKGYVGDALAFGGPHVT